MRKISFFFILVFLLGNTVKAQKSKLQIKQPQIPLLIDREDNVLFYLRFDTKEHENLDEITINLDGDIDLSDIKAIKLYYAGTDSYERENNVFYAPVQYISRDNPKYARSANKSYSIEKFKESNIEKQITLKANQKLYPGINYFWISIEMKTQTSLLSTLVSSVIEARADGQSLDIESDESRNIRRFGKGVRYAGDDGAAAYRIPGLVTTNSGTLLAVYDVRYNNSVDLQEHVDIGLSRSTDKGQTWEKMQIPMSFEEFGGLPKAQNGVGDPAILVDQETGTIWIIAAWTHGMGNGRAWFNSKQGMDLNQTAQLVITRSEDDGKTWSSPINITQQVKDPSWYFLLQGPGKGISMKNGTLVFPIQYIADNKIPNAGIMYSKDHGETWKIENYAHTNTTEAQVIEVAPNKLMLNMRDNRGGSRSIYTTDDLGKTWQEHPSSRCALKEPVCMGSLIQVDTKDNILEKDILLFSNPNTTNDRKNITIKASLDGGLTWLDENQVLLDEDYGWGYSCLTLIDPETVGIIYEASTAHMTFQAIKLTDIIKSDNPK